ncbi:unnamed protein product [Rhizophagus irregularis]|nr:unnamed protein product [Rhizophagus irregularis]
MPFYNLSKAKLKSHQRKHRRERVINHKEVYCIQCYPTNSILADNIPDGFEKFWLWISIQYTAKQYTGATVAAFKVLKTEFFITTQLNTLVELSFYLHKLFELTNGFKSLPTDTQVTNAYQIFHNTPVNNNANMDQGQMRDLMKLVWETDPTDTNNPRNVGNLLEDTLNNNTNAIITALQNNLNAINALTTANQNRTTSKVVDVPFFYGRDDEDPYEWCQLFEAAFAANGWPDNQKIALAAGFLKEAARDYTTEPLPTTTTTTVKPTPQVDEMKALTKQMQQLALNYANLSSVLMVQQSTPRNTRPRPNNNNNQNRQNGQAPTQNSFNPNITCFRYGNVGHISKNCQMGRNTNNGNINGNNNNNNRPCQRALVTPINYADDEAEIYYDEYEDEYEEEWEEEDEYKAYVTTRSKTVPYEISSPRGKRTRFSESRKEDQLRTQPIPPVTPSTPMDMDATTETSTKRKVRTKMVPAPIENVNEFDIAKYISDLPCGLSIGQATAQLPVYRKRINSNYYEDFNSEEETPTTAAKCEFHINQQPVIAVIDSGAAVYSIMTTAMMKTLKLTIDGPSEYVIKTANGTRVRSLGEIQNLPLKVRNLIIKTNVQIIESSDSVFILGNNWMRKVNAALDWDKKTLTIRYNGWSTTVPVIFTLPKSIKMKQSFEYDDEEEYESEELEEAQIYMSDFSGYSTEEFLEFNPWENEVSPAHQNNEYEELEESNPAIYLAQAE